MSGNQFVEIGTIQRTHGINGELQVAWSEDFYFEDNQLESVFIQLEGIPVPFFITSLRSKGSGRAIVKFEDIEDTRSANELVGLTILFPSREVDCEEELEMRDLVGFTVISSQNQLIGEIIGFEEYNVNMLFSVQHQSGSVVIIPAAEDLILEVDIESKTVTMEIPEGLMELYLK